MKRGFGSQGRGGGSGGLEAALERLDRLVNLERADRSEGSAGAAAIRRVDLEPMRDLCARLDHPERRFRSVHVAGTKGKGSLAALVAAAVEQAGHRSGLYTSPHVERVDERVQVGGRSLPPEDLARALGRALDAHDGACADGSAGRDASWFDVLTAAAFEAFAHHGVDLAVVEVGLGGRLDSTNVVEAEVAVVTNIDLEHTAILGSTRAAIAREKAGVAKADGVLVTGVDPSDAEVSEVLRAASAGVGIPLVHVPQTGRLEQRNTALARAVLEALGRRGWSGLGPQQMDDPELVRGARLPGRLELRALGGRPVVLDGAHVPASLEAVLADLDGRVELAGRPQVLLGVGRDKDAQGLLKVLSAHADRVICTSAGIGPYRSPLDLQRIAAGVGVAATVADTAEEGLAEAARRAAPDGWVLVTGSLHLVGKVRGLLDPASEDTACSPSSPTSS